eukprot:s8231_g2.t1
MSLLEVGRSSDQNVPAASSQDVTVALIQDATGAVPDLSSPAETEDLDSWAAVARRWPISKKSRVPLGFLDKACHQRAEGGEAAGHPDQSTQTQEDEDRWNLWLHRCLIGKGLKEYGVTQADLTLAKDLVTKMDLPSQRRDKRWKQR